MSRKNLTARQLKKKRAIKRVNDEKRLAKKLERDRRYHALIHRKFYVMPTWEQQVFLNVYGFENEDQIIFYQRRLMEINYKDRLSNIDQKNPVKKEVVRTGDAQRFLDRQREILFKKF